MADNCLIIKKEFLKKASKSLKTLSTIKETDIENALYTLAEKDKGIMNNSDETIISKLKDHFKFNLVYAETKKEYNDIYDAKELYLTSNRILNSLIDTRNKVIESLGEELAKKYVGPIYYDDSDGLYHFEIANAMPNYKTTSEKKIVNPKFFHYNENFRSKYARQLKEIEKAGHIVNIRPLTKKESETPGAIGADAVIEFSNGKSIQISFSVGSLDLGNTEQARDFYKSIGKLIKNPYYEKDDGIMQEWVVDFKAVDSYFFPLSDLAYEYFINNPEKLQALNITKNPLSSLNKETRGESYDENKDVFAQHFESPFIGGNPTNTSFRFKWAATSDNGFEVSSRGDSFGKKFSALNAKFKDGTKIDGVDVGGKSIEWVYQNVIKKSKKGAPPASDSKLNVENQKNLITTFKNFPEGVIAVVYDADDAVPRVIFKSPSGKIGMLLYEASRDRWSLYEQQKAPNGELTFYSISLDYGITVEDIRKKFVSRYVPKKFIDYIESGQYNKDRIADLRDDPSTGMKRVDGFFRKNFNVHYINTYFLPSFLKERGRKVVPHETIEDFSYYEGYLPLWQEWAKQNPELIEELRQRAEGKVLTDQFSKVTSKSFGRVNQARALADILNDTSKQPSKMTVNSQTTFSTSRGTGYPQRTKENADWSDITLALATDFNTAGEKLTKRVAGDKYVSSPLPDDGNSGHLSYDNEDSYGFYAKQIYEELKKKGKTSNIKLNIAGNGIYSLKRFATQEELNDYVTNLLKSLQSLGVTISEIRSGGQTGVDEAGIIAAQRLGIPNTVHTTSDFKFRDVNGRDISDENQFKARFQTDSKEQSSLGQIQNPEELSVHYYTGDITPERNTVFVFGSNPEGRHGAGAAKVAKDKFGAKVGVGEGLTGNAYALPTKDLRVKKNRGRRSIPEDKIIESIKKLYKVARENPDKQFKVAYRNTTEESLNGYTGLEMIDMFIKAGSIPSNIVFSEEWVKTGKFDSPEITPASDGKLDVTTIANKTAEYGVTIATNLPRTWRSWLRNNPEGIVAYRTNKNTFNTAKAVEEGVIGNPFDWQKYGEKESLQMFYDWLMTGNNFGEAKANETFRQAILKKIRNTKEPNILYYKEKDTPSHATLLGYLILHKELLPKENAVVTNPKLDAAMAVIEKIKEDAEEHVEFDKKTHTYYIDGEKADWSVTEFLHGGKSSISEAWSAVSSRLGNTLDRFVRAYFNGKSIDNIPNLSKTDRENLIEDLERLRRAFDNKYGKGKYRVITDEIPIYGNFHYTDVNGKSTKAIIAGTPDMIIVDSDGNYHIYDMKTKRTNGSSKWSDETIEGYYEQLNMYKSILEARYPEMRGKIKDLSLIKFGVKYPVPQGERGSVGEYDYVTEGEPEDIDTVFYAESSRTEFDNIEEYVDDKGRKVYQAPRLLIEEAENGLFDVPVLDLEGSFEQLSEEEKEIIKEELGNPKHETSNVEMSEVDKQARALYNPGALPASERLFLANSVMCYTSFIITQLQSNPDASKVYFGDIFSNYNFPEMSREDIIRTVGIGRILNYVKERYFNTANRQDIDDFDTLDKLDLAYNNFGALVQSAYSKLITLETTTVVDAAPDEIKREDLDLDMDDFAEGATLEEKDQEYWQQGQRNISARASLSTEIRRVFERLPIVDNNGNYILDKYGYGLMTFVDSGEAMNRIFEWVQDCTTMEEMESILEEHADEYPWLNNILDKIQEEPFRSQFYQNFRKQHIKYGIVTVEYDKDGRRVYSTTIINTKGASQGLLDDVVEAYNSGALTDIIVPIKGDLEGKGRVNVSKVERLLDDIENIKNLFNKTSIDRIVSLNIDNIVKILTTLGIHIDSKVLSEAFAKDANAKNFNTTNIWKILNKAGYILKEILEADEEGNTEYNPMEKGGNHNVYSEYKAIVGILSNYVQDSIEASTYEGGKMYYSYITPSYMGKLVSNFTDALKNKDKFDTFIQDNYSSYRFFKDGKTWNNVWLEQLATSSEAREKFDYKAQLTFDGTPYVDLSELNYTLSLMNEYFYDKSTSNRGSKLAWYRIPILANKPSSEFIRFTRYTGRKYKESITDGMKKVLNQEIMRIRTVLERALNNNIQMIGVKDKVTFDIDKNKLDLDTRNRIKEGKLTNKDLKSSLFTKSGANFKFLSAFNTEIANNTEFGKMLINKINGKRVNETKFDALFRSTFNKYMDARVKMEIEHWKSIGLYDTETKTISTKEGKKKITTYKYASNLGRNEEAINDSLEEYVWNDMFATINIIELTATDLAYYRNMEDFQKRYSQLHAPAMRVNINAVDAEGNLYSADGMERTMYLRDSIKKSEIVKNVEIALNHQGAKLSGREKEHFTMMKDLILSSFDDINVADAQAYSSPTSFRKKLGMMGRWTEEMEEAYKRIISGDYNVMDLAIMLQPMKPFVYSQIRKSSGAKTMSNLKVPVQNKNSEYMLFLSNALMRGDKQKNKLIAIYDFMEDSAYDGRISKYGEVIKQGTYNGKGIDTIQFQSAVNSGSLGAIDINNLETYEEVKSALEKAAYYNSDRSESSDNNMDRYNDQFVHTIPFEDYGLQQETPAHLLDHEQLMGSQVRILSISDITPGTSFDINGETLTDTELREEYMNLIAENIRDSYDQLIEDFKLTGTKLEKNAAISRLLKEAILKDQRYGADLLRACSLNEDGDFVIPPNDPIQSIRIQQLLNSIVKSRINKQKVKGGPVVQASVFGMSDDLHIVWDEKNPGKIKYFECYMPVPSAELEEALTRYDSEGHAYIMSMDEAVKEGIITEDMRKVIGYRIPTEDKYSMAPLYIKDFLPKAAGEAIMMPKEITKLAGSDFDIDKIYIMLKAFTSETTTDWEGLKKDIMNSESVEGAIANYKEEDKKKGVDSKPRKRISDAVDITINQIQNGQKFGESDKFGQKIQDYYNENKDKYTKSKLKLSTRKRDARNNRIFDLQWAVLTSEDTVTKMFNPGSFDIQKKTARINIILNNLGNRYTYSYLSKLSLSELDDIVDNEVTESGRNIIFPTTQTYFHKQNMTAGKLIGIFANNNTSHAFLQMQDIYLNVGDTGFMFDGVKINSSQNNKLDALYGRDGSLISKTIAGFLAASVDAVKDPVLNFMNLNTFTANTAMLLVRLGFDSDSVGLFLNQPIIRQVTDEYFKRNNEKYTTVDEVVNDILYNDLELASDEVEDIEKDLATTPFKKEDLAEQLGEEPDVNFQASALVLFRKLAKMAQDLNTITFLTKFNSVTNAPGPTIADNLVMIARYKDFLDKMESINPPFNVEAKSVINNNPILKAIYDTTIGEEGAARLLFKDYFPHFTSTFINVLNRFRQNIKGQLDSKTINKIVGDYLFYKMTLGENPVIGSSEENRNKFINEFTKVYSEEASKIEGNDLLQVIKIKSRNRRCPIPTLEAKTGNYSIDVQERVKSAWSDLILNPNTHEFANDLFFYNIFRSGFTFSPKSFGHLASVDVRLEIPGYIETLRDVEFNDTDVNIDDFMYMFLRNHSNEYKLVPRLEDNGGITIDESISKVTGKKELNITYGKSFDKVDSIIVERNPQDITYAPVIMYNDTLYMLKRGGTGYVTYSETTPLGNPNNFLEYSPEGADTESVIKDNKTKKSSTSSRKSTSKSYNRIPSKDTTDEVESKEVMTNEDIKDFFSSISAKEWKEIQANINDNSDIDRLITNALDQIVRAGRSADRSQIEKFVKNKLASISSKVKTKRNDIC